MNPHICNWVLVGGIIAGTSCGSDSGSSAGDGGGEGEAEGEGQEGEGSGDVPTIEGCEIFPADNPWNMDISDLEIHERSDDYMQSIGLGTGLHPDFGTFWKGAPIGIPYTTVDSEQPFVDVSFYYPDSDTGPYPIPPDPPIEGGADADGDRHVLVLERDNCVLYELFDAWPNGDGSWAAGSGAIFDLSTNELRPDYWTSADAAGLPIVPGLVRWDEIDAGEIRHALRFTVEATQRGFIHPATHYASDSDNGNLPPMGLRVRLRPDFDASGLSPAVQVIAEALKRYGLILADNGSNWYVSGTHDTRWDDDALSDLSQITGADFVAVHTGEIIGPK